MLPPGAILELKIYQNAFAARVLPWTPLGELTVPQDPVAGFQGAASWQGR